MNARLIRDALAEAFGGRRLLYAVLFGLAYWLLRRYCLSLPAAGSTISYIWLPDGLLLGVLLCTRARHWLPFLLVTLVIGLVDTRRALGPALLAIALNIFEPVLVAALLKRMLGSPPRFDSIKSVLALFLCTVPLMAGILLLSSAVDWFADPGHYWETWRVWFVSDTLGMLLLAPLVLAWLGDGARPPWRGTRAVEVALAFSGLIVAAHVVYSMNDIYGRGVTIAMVVIPFLIWIALRLQMRGATLAIVVFSLQSYWYTANGVGHFARNYQSASDSLVALQIFLLVGTLVALLPAALITERHQALARSDEWRRRFESVLRVSHSLMYEVKPGGRAFHWAGDVRDVLGIAPEGIPTAAEWIERVHPEDRHLVEGIRARFATGELNSIRREYRLRRDDGSYRYVGVTAYVVPDPERGPGAPLDPHQLRIVGAVRDIDDKKRAEEEKRVLEERLKQAQKMEAIGRFADGIAHDFNNILGAILGYGELAKARAPAGSDLRRYLETIHTAGERGKSLVSQILTFSRGKPVEKQPVLIDEIIEEVVAQVRGSLPRGVSIRLSGEFRGAVVLGDPTQIHQLAMNLCTNAIQAMPEGGEVRLTVQVEAVEEARDAYLGHLKRGNYVLIEVRDTGMGMDEATKARIFEPFFTTKATGEGTGLGLSLVQSIALEHGGALDIETAPGRGTRIGVRLPEFAGDWKRTAAPQRDLPRGTGQTVLVVDDEPALANLAQEMLAELGYEPVAHTSSVEALAAFERDPARYDAVVSDEVMPELTGTQLATRVRARTGVPVLLISGFGGPGFEIRARDAGVSRVLRKPYQKRELAEALASALSVKA
jgi:PAS domain S-box-containing protein